MVYVGQDELGQAPTIYYADANEERNPATPTQDEGSDEDYEDPYVWKLLFMYIYDIILNVL